MSGIANSVRLSSQTDWGSSTVDSSSVKSSNSPLRNELNTTLQTACNPSLRRGVSPLVVASAARGSVDNRCDIALLKGGFPSSSRGEHRMNPARHVDARLTGFDNASRTRRVILPRPLTSPSGSSRAATESLSTQPHRRFAADPFHPSIRTAVHRVSVRFKQRSIQTALNSNSAAQQRLSPMPRRDVVSSFPGCSSSSLHRLLDRPQRHGSNSRVRNDDLARFWLDEAAAFPAIRLPVPFGHFRSLV